MFMVSLDANSEANDETYGTEIYALKDYSKLHRMSQTAFWKYEASLLAC